MLNCFNYEGKMQCQATLQVFEAWAHDAWEYRIIFEDKIKSNGGMINRSKLIDKKQAIVLAIKEAEKLGFTIVKIIQH